MIDLKSLQKQVALLEADLKPKGLADPRLKVEWTAARNADRTAATFETWLGERVTQVAVAWVLSTVFVRFCEDNGLIEYPFIAGPGDRAQLAADLQAKFYENHPESDDLGWLRAAIEALSVSPVTKGLFDRRHNPMWTIQPTPQAIKALLAYWRQPGEDGQIRWDLTDASWNTRFLGDLYQDLSEAARKTYALLQTPEFVEEFILNYTLDPAIEEFGLTPAPPVGHEDLPPGLRVIDPACGSGHFLLGAFNRLLAAWETQAPTLDKYQLTAKALTSVHGVDKNPFAAAIARFRLMLAAMRAAGIDRLTERVDFPINIAVGDSLLHGKGAPGQQGEFDFGGDQGTWTYKTEDVDDYIKSCHILEFGSYHVVVANPPYITPKDEQEREKYRNSYKSCHMQYALSVPFAERIFQLAIRDLGYTGQITANSFMKREFGKKLIEEYFLKVDLTHVIDTSGVYIPGHGTPTVILFGRQRLGRGDSAVRAALGVRGERGEPDDPEQGSVWQAILHQIDNPGSESEWISVADVVRSEFSKHPWTLSGGGAASLFEAIESLSRRLGDQLDEIGRTTVVGEDDAWVLPDRVTAARIGMADGIKEFVVGDSVRDYAIGEHPVVWNPYLDAQQMVVRDADDPLATRILWPVRAILERRKVFGKTLADNGRPWYVHLENYTTKLRLPLSIAFAFVTTHNHFALDHGGKIFKQSAPVIKLPESATEDDHLALVGILNSSTTCFWLKQVSQAKAGTSNTSGGGDRWSPEAWIERYEFTGTKLEEYPLPADLPLEFGRMLDAFARQLAATSTHEEDQRIRGQMIALQEELDWDVYHRYGLLSDEQAAELIATPDFVPNLVLGQRAFEIVMGRKMASGELETQWFARHRSTPITEIPQDWPEEYRQVVERRIEIIESNRNIGLIERPELKGQDADLADVLKEIITGKNPNEGEHVPFLAAQRYKPTGLDKRAQWERTWDLQREEDATGKRLDIPVPPKYQGTDFQKQSYWRHRGKLDVPKERFISYPGASPDSDKDSVLIGWAGWTHKDRALALIELITDRSETDGWPTDRLTPLLAGLLEVMPWVRQWHNDIDPAFGQSPAQAYDAYLTAERESRNLTEDSLRTWRPQQPQRGRRRSVG